MAKTERALRITEDLKNIIEALNTRYPNFISGDTLYRCLLAVSTDYTKTRMIRDMTYLNGKGYVMFKGRHGVEAMTISVNDCAFALSPQGWELANRLADDPTLDLWPEM